MDRPLIIGIDVDNVLNNFFPLWVDMYNKEFGKNIDSTLVEDYDLRKIFPDDDEWEKFYSITKKEEFYQNLKSDPVARIVIQEILEKSNGKCLLITGTPPEMASRKISWINDNFSSISNENVLFVPEKSKKYVFVDLLIEDNPETLRATRATGILLNKNYNIKYEFYDAPHIHRVNDWEDIRNILVEKYNLLPQECPELDKYKESFGAPTLNNSYVENTDSGKLIDKLLKCKTKQDFANLLDPYFKRIYDAGYNSALGDLAQHMKELDKE